MKLILSVFTFKTSDESVKPNESTSHFVLFCQCYFIYRMKKTLNNCLQNEKKFND